ncbi:MAG: PASTA domain-containing protein [Rudaea sp.]|uniref:PASTA domain-containing protein n=1 Tax=Rudaea sp. TaxID=2136325 RepID=UPI0039E6AF9E
MRTRIGAKMPRAAMRGLCALFLLIATATAQAAEHRFALYLDTDANAATGCTLAAPNGAVTGVEQVLTTVVTTSTTDATVSRIERQVCSGGSLGAASVLDPGSWSAGIGNGSNGTAAIETAISLSLLPTTGTMRVTPVSTNASGGQDETAAFAVPLGDGSTGGTGTAVPAPLSALLSLALALAVLVAALWWRRRHPQAFSPLLSLCLALLTTLAGAIGVSVVLDGNVGDWSGVSPAVTSPQNGPLDADMVAVYWQKADGNLYFRIDADVQPDAQVSAAVTVDAGPDQSIVLPATASLAGSATLNGGAAAFAYQWTYVSGPAAVVFADATQAATTATFLQTGDYVLQLQATTASLSNTAQLTIHVSDTGPTLAAIADRRIALGATLDFAVSGSSPSIDETLTYTLPAAPSGGALQPASEIVWTPTAAQLGANTFTAKVTDSHGRSDSKSFTVTVVHDDRAPVLDAQADATVAKGTTFTRTIHATDPDGDAITYTLPDAPAGMALAGTQLTWPTAAVTPGTYYATVQASDPSGLFDAKRFAIVVTDAAAPVAQGDVYSVHLNDTLAIDAAGGVLANDVDPMGGTLTATQLTDPDKGTLDPFGADGSFTYTAPATLGLPAFTPTLSWFGPSYGTYYANHVRIIPVAGRSAPVILEAPPYTGIDGSLRAVDAASGTELWNVHQFSTSIGVCYIHAQDTTDGLAAGDIDDSGHTAVVAVARCDSDRYYYAYPNTAAPVQRFVALDAQTGAVKWLSDRLGTYVADADGHGNGAAYSLPDAVAPAIARLHDGETPSVLFDRAGGGSSDTQGGVPFCQQFDDTATDPDQYCIGVLALDGATGQVRRKWIAPSSLLANYWGNSSTGGHPGPMVVAPITAACSPCLIAGGAVWDADGHLVSNTLDDHATMSTALAKLDDGSTAIIRYELGGGHDGFVSARRADGTLLWKTGVSATTVHGQLSVGDLDGDGSPDILVPVERQLWALDAKGQVKWIRTLQDTSGNRLIDQDNRPAIFDLDGDGTAEAIVETTQGLLFFDGRDGSTKAQMSGADLGVPAGNSMIYFSAYESPVVADVDGSGQASIVLHGVYSDGSNNTGFLARIVAGGGTTWRDARPVFGQQTYHVADIADDGSIPGFPLVDNFATPATNVFGNQPQISTPVDPRTVQQTTFTYAASANGLTSAPATVTITLLPQNRPPVFTTTPPTRYTSIAAFMAAYVPHAIDPDVGDTVTYSIAGQGGSIYNCTINASSGQISACGTYDNSGGVIVIAATDSLGAVAYQAIPLQYSAGTGTVPDVTGQLQADAATALTGAGFAVGNVNTLYASQPAGTVLSQSPGGGTSGIALGEAVALTVSKGPQPVAVPFVVGVPRVTATTQLTALGFSTINTYVYSNSVPADQVMAQSPDAGTLLSPVSTNPVTLTVSAGSGLKLRLSQNYVNANHTVTATATHVALDGTETAFAGATLSIAPLNASSTTGALPTISGTTITPAADSFGAYVVQASDTSSGAVDTATLDIASNDSVSPDLAAFAQESQTIATVTSLLRDAQAAIAANDTATAKAKALAAVDAWRGFDRTMLRLASPLSLPGGFPPTLDDVIAHGDTQSADDKIAFDTIETAISQFDTLIATANDAQVTDTAFAAAVAPLAQTAALYRTTKPGVYGIIDSHESYIALMAHRIPDLMDALTNLLEAAANNAGSSSAATATKADRGRTSASAAGAGGVRSPRILPQSLFLETLLSQSIAALLDAMDPSAQMLSNAQSQCANGMVIMAWAKQLRQAYGAVDLPGIVAGVSASFNGFDVAPSWIEVNGVDFLHPETSDVIFIGPDAAGTVGSLVGSAMTAVDLADSLAKSTLALANLSVSLADAKFEGGAITASEILESSPQNTQRVLHGCIYSSDPTCGELVYPYGFDSVYHQAAGSLAVPLPVIILVRNPKNGQPQIGTFAFMPKD